MQCASQEQYSVKNLRISNSTAIGVFDKSLGNVSGTSQWKKTPDLLTFTKKIHNRQHNFLLSSAADIMLIFTQKLIIYQIIIIFYQHSV